MGNICLTERTMNIPIRTDPDFKPDTKRTIDLRPFFDKPNIEEENIDEEETFDIRVK